MTWTKRGKTNLTESGKILQKKLIDFLDAEFDVRLGFKSVSGIFNLMHWLFYSGFSWAHNQSCKGLKNSYRAVLDLIMDTILSSGMK